MAYLDAPLRGQQRRLQPQARPAGPRAWGPGGTGWQQRQGLAVPARPPAPAAKPTAPTPTPQQPGASPYDASADPILQQIRALTGKQRGDLESGARKGRTQLAIEYGDESLARQYGGDSFAQAARDNPFSVAAELARSYQRGGREIDESYNQDNLFYSGARGQALTDLAFDYQRRSARAESEKQQRLSAITAELAQALAGLDREEIDALGAANSRALERALEYGIDPGVGGSFAAPGVPPILAELIDPTRSRRNIPV